MEWLLNPEIWIALVTLTVLEIVLGIDNIIVIVILTGRLPQEQRARARTVGLSLAVITRLLLLGSLFWLAHLTVELFTIFGMSISMRDLVLIGGGLFLLAKSTSEIHATLEDAHAEEEQVEPKYSTFPAVITQIIMMDIVFSLDSVITAIGLSDILWVMATAIVIAVAFMIWFSGPVSEFVHRHPTIKILALAFLILIGVALIADGFDMHIPRGYLYFGMAFSFFVELLNMRLRAGLDRKQGGGRK